MTARQSTSVTWLFLVAAFAARLAYGLAGEFWADDERQIYLIGLQFYTTGVWPLFGPDVVYTQTQIPGGLQGLLVGGPLFLAPLPEAPFVLLNLLSLAGLALAAWYIGVRLPSLPRWFLWPWIFFSPWTLNFSTHIVNPSYVLPGAIVFFVSAYELVPALSMRRVPRPLAYAGLGAGLLWVAQLHLSAALLLPIALIVLAAAARENPRDAARGLPWLLAGAAAVGATLVPTWRAGGLDAVAQATGANTAFAPGHLMWLPELAARYFSFGSFEIARFVGSHTEDRLAFLAAYPWAAPFALFVALCGVAQTLVLLSALFWRRGVPASFPAIRRATLVVLALLAASFVLSVKEPASHTFYVTLPVVMFYAAHCWEQLWTRRGLKTLAIAFLAAGAVTHAAIGWRNFHERSLYKDRALVVQALEKRDHRILGERRPDEWRRAAGAPTPGR